MRRIPSHPRGMALVMAMIVVVLITMLVAGAISFTGTEMSASQIQAQEDEMSSCLQAARNLFIARMRMVPVESVETVNFSEVLDPADPMHSAAVATGHLRGTDVALKHFADATRAVQDPNSNVVDISNSPGQGGNTRFYAVTAVCRANNDPGSPEREIEFLVKVGL